ncbi:MAG: hypothetical protein AB1486_06580 [Planctomycetota bacterium]
MEKATSPGNVQEIHRRLAPLKVTISHLYREMDAAKGERVVTIDRALLESILCTLELVVDDVDNASGAVAAARSAHPEEKKFIETPRVAPVRQT